MYIYNIYIYIYNIYTYIYYIYTYKFANKNIDNSKELS